jgi:hypothetical protein
VGRGTAWGGRLLCKQDFSGVQISDGPPFILTGGFMSIPGHQIVVPNGIVVWLDVDDVLVQFHSFFNKFLQKKGYIIPVDYKPEKYSYAELMPEEEFLRYFDELGAKWPAKLKAYKGAAEFTRQLSEIGCRVVLITSIDGQQGPERLKNLCKHKIYFDEMYLTRGRQKSEFASWLSMRYVNSRGNPVKNILVDDYAKNAVEFVKMVPNSMAATIDIGYSKDWIRRSLHLKKIVATPKNPAELYEATFKLITKLLLGQGKKKKKK